MDINDISAFLDTLGKGLTIKVTVVRKFKIVRMMHFFLSFDRQRSGILSWG